MDTKDIDRLRRIPIADVLASFGCDMSRTSRGKYHSPFRVERTPSFFVDDARNIYVDYGDEIRPHGVIDLVQRLAGCSFVEALDRLSHMNPSVVLPPSPPRKRSPHIVVTDVCDGVLSAELLDYARSRYISEDILSRYCNQVEYVTKGRRHCAIGFRNRVGWSLRNAVIKYSTGQDVSFINAQGTYDASCVRTADMVRVFEGFFDFLSWLHLTRLEVPGTDVVVLNSVSNIRKALPLLAAYPTVSLYLDNDGGGDKGTTEITESVSASGGRVLDRRFLFSSYGDVAEAWKAQNTKKG